MTWHVSPEHLAAYQAGILETAGALSTEAHVSACDRCRTLIDAAPDWLDESWRAIRWEVESPPLGLGERLLLAAGVRADWGRLLMATRSLRAPWLLAASLVLAMAAAAASFGTGTDRAWLFLAVAPMLPVAGVAVAYRSRLNHFEEIEMAAPLDSFRVLLIRSAAVVMSTGALTAVAALFVTAEGWWAAAWLLPSLALTVISLALASRLSGLVAASWVSGVWLAGLMLGWQATSDPLFIARQPSQAALAVLVVLAVGSVLIRRDSYRIGGV